MSNAQKVSDWTDALEAAWQAVAFIELPADDSAPDDYRDGYEAGVSECTVFACQAIRNLQSANQLTPDRDPANLLSVIADIREKSGLGAGPMLSELADAVGERCKARVDAHSEVGVKEANQTLLGLLQIVDEIEIGPEPDEAIAQLRLALEAVFSSGGAAGVVKAEPVAITDDMVTRALSVWPRNGTPYVAIDIMRAALTAALASKPEGER